ncbi:MAG: cytochrome P450 [Acidobacteriaceae bacterium]|nr:cytochrome P450 [Acidobacteriaceae bacterium]
MAFSTAEQLGPKPPAVGPRGLPFVGASLQFRRDPTGFLLHLARVCGDLVEFRLMGCPAFFFGHPDYVREILVTRQANFTKSRILQRARLLLGEGLLTNEGESHLRQRRLVQPAFYHQRLQSYAEIITTYTLRARERFEPQTELDILDEMMRLTLSIVAKALFSTDAEGDASAVSQALDHVEDRFRFLLLPFSDLLTWLPLPPTRRFERAKAVLDRTVYRIIRERRAASGASADLLSALLAARDEEGSAMTDEQVRDEVLTLFLAGHETTAIGLTWTWYLLAQNPHCEQRLHDEIDGVLHGRAPRFDDIPSLRYTEMVLAESMRLYPPVWTIGRMPKEAFELAGVTIPQGAICLMSQFVMHRDPRFYPDPERFDPERWHPDIRESRPKFAYFPFGGGARLCIGERFAWMEMILVLATLCQKWRFLLVDDQPVGLKPLITLHPDRSIQMLAEPRERSTENETMTGEGDREDR